MKTLNPLLARVGLLCAVVLGLAWANATATAQTLTTLRSFGPLTDVPGYWPGSELVAGPDGTLYGTAKSAGGNAYGTVFKVQPNGVFTVLRWFTNILEGTYLDAGLTLSGSVLYGATTSGGSSNSGTVFKLNTDGTDYTVLKHFTGSDGRTPLATLTLSGGTLYGTTAFGGDSNGGTVFRVNTDGTGYAVLKHFVDSDGLKPQAGLTLSGSVLYGTTFSGGSSGRGTVFKLNTDGTGHTVLKHFSATGSDLSGNYTNSDGASSYAGLVLSGNTLYGTTPQGGSSGQGTVFKVQTDGTGYTVLKHFSEERIPYAGLTLSGSTLYGTTLLGGGSDDGTVFKLNTDGTGYTILKDFTGSDGQFPAAGVTLSGNALYGTTSEGGSWAYGTVFKLNTDGTGHTVLKHFSGSDGSRPYAGLTLSGNVIYGTTSYGGAGNYHGTVFRVNTDGTGYTVLKHFSGSDGSRPYAGLTLSGNVIHGITASGGAGDYHGTVFRVNTDGTGHTVLKHFSALDAASHNSDGANPQGILRLSGGVLYGTASSGGTAGYGTVFRMNTDGTGYSVLKHFSGLDFVTYTNGDGASPQAGLTLSGSVLYGTAYRGGSSGHGTVFKVNTDGTGYAVLKHFSSLVSLAETNSDGANPQADLTLSGSVLYGTTQLGGALGMGTVFKVNTDGTGYSVLKHFSNSDGTHPHAGLTLFGNRLYGTTERGGSLNYGTVFRLNTDGTGYTVLRHFAGIDGANPGAGLTLSGSTLYGTTAKGGSWGWGTVFNLDLSVPLTVRSLSNAVVLSWTDSAFALQAAPAVTGTYTNIPGASSPHAHPTIGPQRFFRLRMD